MLSVLFIIIALINQVLSSEPLESPQTQHVLNGTSANFTCRVSSDNAFWNVQLSNNSQLVIRTHNSDSYNADGIFTETSSNGGIQTLTLRIIARFNYNNTQVVCRGHAGSGEWSSNPPAKLLVYESLRPLPPSMIKISTVNTTALLIRWIPSFLWEGYVINYYSINAHHINGSISLHVPGSVNPSDEYFTYIRPTISLPPCTQLNVSITAVSPQYGESDPISAVSGFDTVPGIISQDLIITNVYFRSNGTPLLDLKFQLPATICSYQRVNYTITVNENSRANTVVMSLGPYMSTGPQNVKHSITFGLILDRQYSIRVMLNSVVGNSLTKVYFNTSLDPDLYPTNPSCITGESPNEHNTHLITYKVAMGICLGLAALMLFTLVFVLICFLIHRQRKISQGKALNISTNRVQNAMVHNPIYDGPVYESVQPHFDTLTTSLKQDLSLSNTLASNSPTPRSSTPPNTGNSNSSQKTARYLDGPIQPRSQSLSHPSTHNNNNPRSTSVCAQSATRVMGLKKNGKERNKLHLTLTLNEDESANPARGAHCEKEEAVLAGDIPGNDGNKRAATSDGDENYTVMSPIKGKDSGKIRGVIELSPEDTEKYKEEIN